MIATINNTSSVNSATGLSTTTTGTGQTSAQEQSDRFLKLLVAQLNNQDPMNPMDNAQMTSQIAQINTVSGIQQLNDTMKSMAISQGASMVGREVLTQGNQLSVSAGIGKGSLTLPTDADKVTVQVSTASGQAMGTIQLGAMTSGSHNFEWNASAYTGTTPLVFKVTASMGGKSVDATSLMRSTVESVSADAGTMNLHLKSGTTVAYSAVKAIL